MGTTFINEKMCEYILSVYDTKDGFNKYMSHCFPGDEVYFHTIIHNSEFSNNIAKETIKNRQGIETELNCTYFEYPDEVTIYTNKQDYEWLKKTDCLFVRKINETSIELLDEIDRNIN